MNTPSETVQRITGTYIEDDLSPKPPLFQWIQAECRSGCFSSAITECLKQQPEPLRGDLILVEEVDKEKITLRVPARVVDHESPSTFGLEVLFELNPATLSVKRLTA